jgi:hypothetical protein
VPEAGDASGPQTQSAVPQAPPQMVEVPAEVAAELARLAAQVQGQQPGQPDPVTGRRLEHEATPVLADPGVSARKLDEQLARWEENRAEKEARGIHLLRRDGLAVEVAFVGRVLVSVPVGPAGQTVPAVLPVVSACVRIDFTNYDVWAPSVRFIDFFNRKPGPPAVRALRWENGQEQNVLLGHPRTQELFLCLRGTREYHEHPEHNGDDWLLLRNGDLGTLHRLTEQVWERMARNVVGLRFESQAFVAPDGQVIGGFHAVVSQHDIDSVRFESVAPPQAPAGPDGAAV